jgi:hypothetical protein
LKRIIFFIGILTLITAFLIPMYAIAECPAGYFIADGQQGAAWYNIEIDGTLYEKVAHTYDATTGKDCLYDVTGLGAGQHVLRAQPCYQCSGAAADADCQWCADWTEITAVKPEVAGGLSFQW